VPLNPAPAGTSSGTLLPVYVNDFSYNPVTNLDISFNSKSYDNIVVNQNVTINLSFDYIGKTTSNLLPPNEFQVTLTNNADGTLLTDQFTVNYQYGVTSYSATPTIINLAYGTVIKTTVVPVSPYIGLPSYTGYYPQNVICPITSETEKYLGEIIITDVTYDITSKQLSVVINTNGDSISSVVGIVFPASTEPLSANQNLSTTVVNNGIAIGNATSSQVGNIITYTYTLGYNAFVPTPLGDPVVPAAIIIATSDTLKTVFVYDTPTLETYFSSANSPDSDATVQQPSL